MQKFLNLIKCTLFGVLMTLGIVWLLLGVFLLFVLLLPSCNIILGYNVMYGCMIGSLSTFCLVSSLHLLRRKQRADIRARLKEKLTKLKK